MGDKHSNRYRPTGVDANGDEFCFGDDYLEARCPNLYDLLARQVADGRPIKPCSVSLFGQDGKLTACLNWEEEGLILFKALKSTEDCFEALEATLADTKPGWRKKKLRFSPVRK